MFSGLLPIGEEEEPVQRRVRSGGEDWSLRLFVTVTRHRFFLLPLKTLFVR